MIGKSSPPGPAPARSAAREDGDQGVAAYSYDAYARDVLQFVPGSPERLGMDTWYMWTAGNEYFWRELTIEEHGKVELLRLLIEVPRDERFQRLGTINDPGCTAATGPDEYGLTLDRPREKMSDEDKELYGEPTGIIGLRKFRNPRFQTDHWDAQEYLNKWDEAMEPPYLIGMSCALCHVAFDPIRPPRDPAEPTWYNLSPIIGNQYLKENELFLGAIPDVDPIQQKLKLLLGKHNKLFE